MIKGSKMGSQEVFLDEPTDIPVEVADYLAEQLGIEDASVLKAYGERENTRLDHVRELRRRPECRSSPRLSPRCGHSPDHWPCMAARAAGQDRSASSRGRRTRYGRVGPAAARRR